jgi:hypothetical protein
MVLGGVGMVAVVTGRRQAVAVAPAA